MQDYIKILSDVIYQISIDSQYSKITQESKNALSQINEALQTISQDDTLVRAFCQCMDSYVFPTNMDDIFDFSLNASTRAKITKIKEEQKKQFELNDTSTEDIVKNLKGKGKKTVSYAEIYDEIIEVCIKNFDTIKDFCFEEYKCSFPTIDIMNQIYREVMNDDSLDFYVDLRDELILNLCYKDNNTVWLNRRLKNDDKLTAESFSTRKSKFMENANHRINRIPMPNIDFIERFSLNKKLNPFMSNEKVNVSDYNKFINDFLNKPRKISDTLPSYGLQFKVKNRSSLQTFKPFEIYYVEEIFKPSYIKSFGTAFHQKINEYINDCLTQYDNQFFFDIKAAVDGISAITLNKVPVDFNAVSVLEDAREKLSNLEVVLNRYKDKLLSLLSYDNIAKVYGDDAYGSQGLIHYPSYIENSIENIDVILSYVRVDGEIDSQNLEKLIKGAYEISDKKVIFEQTCGFGDNNRIIHVGSLTQKNAEGYMLNNVEAASGVDMLSDLAKIFDTNKMSDMQKKNKVNINSMNSQKKFCSIIYKALLYCCDVVNENIIKPLSELHRLADFFVDEQEIEKIYIQLCQRYSTITVDGKYLICRSFLNADCDKNLDFISCLNYEVRGYIDKKFCEVKEKLENSGGENGDFVKVTCDTNYTYSYALYNQFVEISNTLILDKNSYKVVEPHFSFTKNISSEMNQALDIKLASLQDKYMTEFINTTLYCL